MGRARVMPYRYLSELGAMPWLKGIIAVCFTFILEMVGHPNSAAKWLFLLMLADFILGFARAWQQKDIQAIKLRSGAFKFFWYWVAVAIFVMADAAIQPAMPVTILLRDAFIAYLAANEALSCVDHLGFFKVPVPKHFLERLRKYREGCCINDQCKKQDKADDEKK